MAHLVAPSILAADFLYLERDIKLINGSSADWLHVDVMDGVFVPNISFGQSIVAQMARVSTKPLDVHLMIVNPDKYLEEFRSAGAEVITVHVEACKHLHRTIQSIKALDCKAGVALNPHTSVTEIEDVLEDLDLVCLMSVNPGFGGQKFIYRTLHKIEILKEMITSRNLEVKIEIDGGVGLHNAESILKAGADILVAGSSVFKAQDPIDAIVRMKDIGTYTY